MDKQLEELFDLDESFYRGVIAAKNKEIAFMAEQIRSLRSKLEAAERRYGELVEVTSAKTDQAKEKI